MLPIIISTIESPEDRDLMIDFYTKYKSRLYSEAHKFFNIPEDVEDIVYEALTKIIDKMEVFRKLQELQQIRYALTTVRNLSYILLKRNSYFTMISFDTIDFELAADDDTTTEKVAEKRYLLDQVWKLWKDIDINDRMLLEQKYILQWSDEDIAELLEIQPQSVRMRLTRAKRKVLNVMQKNNFSISDIL